MGWWVNKLFFRLLADADCMRQAQRSIEKVSVLQTSRSPGPAMALENNNENTAMAGYGSQGWKSVFGRPNGT